MFVGHYGAAFVAKRIEPRAPLWLLLLAVQWVDVLWAVFMFLGIERGRLIPELPGMPVSLDHMPFTHSLAATAVWSAFGFVVARQAFGATGRVAAVVAAAIGSHWFLDLLVHRPDLPLLWGEPKLGFAMWNAPLFELAFEITWLLAAVAVLTRAADVPEPTKGKLWRLAFGLVVLQLVTSFGPVPPALFALVASALAVFLLVPWFGARVERA